MHGRNQTHDGLAHCLAENLGGSEYSEFAVAIAQQRGKIQILGFASSAPTYASLGYACLSVAWKNG
jgi:hypothetical protein